MRNISEDITNMVLRIRDGKHYYFDENGKWSVVSVKKSKELELKYPGRLDEKGAYVLRYENIGIRCDDARAVKKEISKLKVGDSVQVLDDCLENALIQTKQVDRLDRFVTKIQNPLFERRKGNTNPNTFDYIHVEVNIVKTWEGDRIGYIQKHKKEIIKMVLEKIEASKKFYKFGVSIDSLRVVRITLNPNGFLDFILEKST